MFFLLGVSSILFVFNIDYVEAVCGSQIVWRNNNLTCPERAVCADVFSIIRDWRNGTTCQERRTLNNCMCPGGLPCPTSDDNHMLSSSGRHKFYTCRPTCTLPWCGNIRLPHSSYRVQGRQNNGRARNPTPRFGPPEAMASVQNAPEFLGKMFYRMSCRCPRHHFPSERNRDRSVRAFGSTYNWALGQITTRYICVSSRQEYRRPDPCQ